MKEISIFTSRITRLLFLLPIVIMIASSLFFDKLTNEVEANLLDEKFAEKKLAVAAMIRQTDALLEFEDDWVKSHEYYRKSLTLACELLDQTHMTHSRLYDETLYPVSRHLSDNDNFDPIIYNNFRTACRNNEMGDLIINYKPPIGPERDMYVHYRWVKTNKRNDGRFLMVVAISKLTIANNTSVWIKIGSVILIVVTTFFNILMVIFISLLVNERSKQKRDPEISGELKDMHIEGPPDGLTVKGDQPANHLREV